MYLEQSDREAERSIIEEIMPTVFVEYLIVQNWIHYSVCLFLVFYSRVKHRQWLKYQISSRHTAVLSSLQSSLYYSLIILASQFATLIVNFLHSLQLHTSIKLVEHIMAGYSEG